MEKRTTATTYEAVHHSGVGHEFAEVLSVDGTDADDRKSG